MSGVRVLVCGGRDFRDHGCVFDKLTAIHTGQMITCIIEGGAPGADEWAAVWADMVGVPRKKFPADWASLGRAAGPLRNQRMLDEGKPDLVLAFPGGKGTASMVRLAKKAGVKVIEIASPAPAQSR